MNDLAKFAFFVMAVLSFAVIAGAYAFGDYRFYLEYSPVYRDARPMHWRMPADQNLNGREMPCEARVQRNLDVYPLARCVPVSLPHHWLNMLKRKMDEGRLARAADRRSS